MSTKVKDVRLVLVRTAGEQAKLDGSATIEAEHVLLALAQLQDSTAARLLASAGMTSTELRAALDREWEQSLSVAGVAVAVAELPTATPDHSRSPSIGASTKLLLERAMAAAAATGGGRIGTTHMLAGLLADERGRVARTLALAGMDRVALRAQAMEAVEQGKH